MKNFDLKLIEDSVRNILFALGEDPDREGLVETPKRVAKMYDEVFEGMKYTNDDIVELFSKSFVEDYDGMIIEKDIPAFSYCEHHMALMYNMNVSIAYMPKGKVIGLSKIVRIVDMVSRRLQLQERLTKDIGDIIMKSCSTDSVAVIVTGEHSCVTTRGIKKNGEKTVTTYFTGDFKNNNELRKEFLNSIGK